MSEQVGESKLSFEVCADYEARKIQMNRMVDGVSIVRTLLSIDQAADLASKSLGCISNLKYKEDIS